MVSIVMSYFRRAQLLKNTIHSIRLQRVPNVELVIVNDDKPQDDIRKLLDESKDVFENIQLIDTNRDYYYRNQNFASNVGIKRANGDIIILQNPENIHCGNLIDGITNLINENKSNKPYFCARCISLKQDENTLATFWLNSSKSDNFGLMNFFQNNEEYCGKTNPRPFFFCAGFLKKDFIDIGGFDERITIRGYDDDLLAFHMKCNNFDIRILHDSPFWVLHQNHQRENQIDSKMSEMNRLVYAQYMNIVNNIVCGKEPPIANRGKEWGLLSGK